MQPAMSDGTSRPRAGPTVLVFYACTASWCTAIGGFLGGTVALASDIASILPVYKSF